MPRRSFLRIMLMMAAASTIIRSAWAASDYGAPVNLNQEEWKQRLTSEQFHILREEGTEKPYSSPLNKEHRTGLFICVGCDLPLFPSKYKFDSGTGWPSFFDTIPGHLAFKVDHKIIVARKEYHCVRCGGHHGHVFDDGPAPTRLRYCSNGVALKFLPDAV